MKKSTKTIAQIITGASAAVTLWCGKLIAVAAEAPTETTENPPTSVKEGAELAHANGMPSELFGENGVFRNVTNTILVVVGFISVVMLIYGGLRYIISGGDSKKVTDAKNTILYAIIGLIISILAYAIVNFVLNTLGGGTIKPTN